ncbi:hypothetical protein ACSBR2_021022 [Camellia fascicularis]
MFTLFVDNLPESMAPRSMYALFLKFAIVKDVFIPQKKRKTTNTRFGFVRFDCPVVASVEEQKANGLWVDDKALIVQSAVYRKEKGIDGRSYVEVIQGAQPRGQTTTTIRVKEIGNGWLYESMIIRLKPNYSAVEVKEELKEQGMKNVIVRGGRRDVVLSFNSREALKSTISKLNVWFQD